MRRFDLLNEYTTVVLPRQAGAPYQGRRIEPKRKKRLLVLPLISMALILIALSTL